MFAKKLAVSLLFGALAAGAAAPADAQVKVGVVTSSTGPIALVGIPQKNSVPLLPTNIGSQTVQYITLDDGSDPTATVAAFKKLITEEKVDAIIGPSGSPNAMGVIQFAAEATRAGCVRLGCVDTLPDAPATKKLILRREAPPER